MLLKQSNMFKLPAQTVSLEIPGRWAARRRAGGHGAAPAGRLAVRAAAGGGYAAAGAGRPAVRAAAAAAYRGLRGRRQQLAARGRSPRRCSWRRANDCGGEGGRRLGGEGIRRRGVRRFAAACGAAEDASNEMEIGVLLLASQPSARRAARKSQRRPGERSA